MLCAMVKIIFQSYDLMKWCYIVSLYKSQLSRLLWLSSISFVLVFRQGQSLSIKCKYEHNSLFPHLLVSFPKSTEMKIEGGVKREEKKETEIKIIKKKPLVRGICEARIHR